MIKRLIRFARLPAPERRDLVAAIALCTLGGALLRVMPFARLARYVGRHMVQSPARPDRATRDQARQIRWAIATAARQLPWKPVCLPQALAAQWMLRRVGIPSTLYFGIDPARGYDAHAWVRAGQVIVAGGPVRRGFTVVSSFA
ncbi:MAG: lasso peptide biosynthesis B2 protein [Gemmatimonadota bacterium]